MYNKRGYFPSFMVLLHHIQMANYAFAINKVHFEDILQSVK